jgi:O-antigen ligase
LIDNITINKNYLENLFNLFFLSGTILGIYSIYLFIESGFNSLLRIGSIWDDLNIMSAYLMILFMFNLSFILNREKGKKLYLYFISLFFISSGIFMTQTRGVWLSIIVSVLIYTIKRPKIIIPFSLIIGFFIFYFYDAITSRFLTVKNFGADLSSLGRLQAWIATISLLKNNLFFGYGFDSFIYLRDSVIPFFLVPVIHSHNTYLRSLLEIGLIGSIFYYYFFFKAIYFSFAVSKKDATKSYKKFSDGLQLSFIGLVVVFFFEPYFSLFGASTFIIWLLISLSFKIYKNISN